MCFSVLLVCCIVSFVSLVLCSFVVVSSSSVGREEKQAGAEKGLHIAVPEDGEEALGECADSAKAAVGRRSCFDLLVCLILRTTD